ncbi:DUF2000 domain-containing protein [Noviherbaspirillum sp.]|uniref:DUF2000 domain-containing protein n=1 Tax=Noviherbaspirillum sp. TaxID=1926288 RepID=UPI002D53949E|nr:DUF2000 domain-containing protein [Noviherbaspirillum sp.]HZW21744.1 DUF2000 domain-containing protein [Noviherbaspirillum sp.]
MDNKYVLIVDEAMSPGAIANTAAVLSASVGRLRPDMIGRDLPDSGGWLHRGITTIAIPVLRGNASLLKRMRRQLKEFEPDLLVVDLISATRITRSYQEYATVLRETPEEALEYFGLALYGDRKTINSLTGSLGLLR